MRFELRFEIILTIRFDIILDIRLEIILEIRLDIILEGIQYGVLRSASYVRESVLSHNL